MRWLIRLPARLVNGPSRERGATATIIAVLLAGGVIMGMLAISVDLGNLTYERRQLQNGADATSLALAAECAGDKSSTQAKCDPAQVEDLLGANSHDELSQYDDRPGIPNGVCARPGVAGTGSLPGCPTVGDVNALRECPPVPDWLLDDTQIPYVETYAATEVAGDGDKLFLPFSRVLAGGASGDAGTSACARAGWGMPEGYSAALPLTFSSCEWDRQTSGGVDYVEQGPVGSIPGYGGGGAGQPAWPSPTKEVIIRLHNPGDTDNDCDWNGKDTGGGFGWLDYSGSDCIANVQDGNWVKIDTGNNTPKPCKAVISEMKNRVVELPVFDCITSSKEAPVGPIPSLETCDPTDPPKGGEKTWYHLAGWAKFYISGYYLPGTTGTGSSTLPGGASCSSGNRCIFGWFLTGQLSAAPTMIGAPGGPNDFGTYVVKPAG